VRGLVAAVKAVIAKAPGEVVEGMASADRCTAPRCSTARAGGGAGDSCGTMGAARRSRSPAQEIPGIIKETGIARWSASLAQAAVGAAAIEPQV